MYSCTPTHVYREARMGEIGRTCLAALCVAALLTLVAPDDNPGTTPHLQEIFVGRCYDYVQTKHTLLANVSKDCQTLWQTFFHSLAYQPPCSLSPTSYDSYMKMAAQVLPKDKALFWSGTFEIAHELANEGDRYVTLEDTLIGYLANSMVFCGQGSDPGLNYSRCPSWNDCPREASELFWASASKTFASAARGEVTVVLNGNRANKPAYSRDSFFSRYELPSLQGVTHVTIMVVHDLSSTPKETCNSGSILQVQQDIKARNIPYTCLDNPDAILHLLCADDPTARECRLARAQTRSLVPRLAASPRLYNDKPDRFTY